MVATFVAGIRTINCLNTCSIEEPVSNSNSNRLHVKNIQLDTFSAKWAIIGRKLSQNAIVKKRYKHVSHKVDTKCIRRYVVVVRLMQNETLNTA